MKSDRRGFLRMSGGVLASGILSPPQPLLARRSPIFSAGPNGGSQKVILDTDPGVDDAFALLLAMRSSELNVVAVTAVAGNVPLSVTLPNALRLVEIADRPDIPVGGGASSPLIRKLVTAAYAHGNNGLAGVEFPPARLQPVKEPAADLICRLVRENAKNICIVGIGPLTNIALALRQDPEIVSMVSSIVLMGGSLSGGNVTPAAEFNFYVDPEAALIVFHSGIPLTMVGLDVTRKVQLREEHVVALEAGKNPSSQAAGRIMRSTMERFRKTGFPGGPTMHDPLALASMIDPEVVTLQDFFVDIETSGEITAGESVGYRRTPIRKSAPLDSGVGAETAPPADEIFKPNAKVAVDVDAERFFRLLISRLTA